MEKMYKINELAQMFDVDRATVYYWFKRKENPLEYVIVGGRRRIPQSALDKFIQAGSTGEAKASDEQQVVEQA